MKVLEILVNLFRKNPFKFGNFVGSANLRNKPPLKVLSFK